MLDGRYDAPITDPEGPRGGEVTDTRMRRAKRAFGAALARAFGAALAAGFVLLVGVPSSLAAQEQDVPQISEARMRVFATVYVAMGEARDDFHAVLGRTHEAQERDRLRAQLRERIETILAEHEMAQEEFEQITLVVSIDEDQRQTFERILAELAGTQTVG